MGNAHPSLFPYEPLPTADGELIVIAGNDGQFRKLCEVLGVPELPRRPAVRAQPGPHRQPRRSCARCWSSGCVPVPRTSGSGDLIAAGVPCAPINTVDGGVGVRRRARASTRWSTVGGYPGVRNPITFSATPARYELPPPGLDEHGEEIRAWLTAT